MEQKISAIANKVAALSPHERSQFFHLVCADNPKLADAIRENLEIVDDEPITETMSDGKTWFPNYPEDLIGKKVGAYLIEKRLGEGGMGYVFLGTQEEPIRRKVAIKLIKSGITCQLSPRRFLAERQAMAMMNHHNIAKIFDAGMTQEGLPYFAMEYIDGQSITQYCQTHLLPIKERIGLFMQVCDAIQHANQNGILHRDLKPSNILVTETDEGPVVKVIDFGIAKSIHKSLTDETLQTEMGRVVGTLQYMSPEQLDPDTHDIDTRSDVYTLGVLLQELLSGLRPFDVGEHGKRDFFAIQNHVLNDDPTKPSIRLASQNSEKLEKLAQNRRLSVKEFKKILRGDLDWIILKAQARSRDDRYVSAYNLKVELQRFLTNQAVLAGPPNLTYRFKKFARRHRLAVAFSAVLLLTVIGALMGVTHGLVKAQQANAKSQTTIDLLKNFLSSPTPSQKGPELKVATLLEHFEPKLQEIQDRDVRLELLHTMANVYESLGQTEKAHTHFQKVLDSLDTSRKPDRKRMVKIKNILYAKKARGQPNEKTLNEIHDFWRTCQKALGDTHPDALAAEFNHAYIQFNMGHYELAYQFSRDLLARKKDSVSQPDPIELQTMMIMGHSLMALERTDESIEIHERALTLAKKLYGENSLLVLGAKGNLATSYSDKCLFQKSWALSKETYEQARILFGERHPTTLSFRRNLASSKSELGYFSEALELIMINHDINFEDHGPSHFETMRDKLTIANLLYHLEDYQLALSFQSLVYENFKTELGPRHTLTLGALQDQAASLACLGQVDKGIEIQKEVVQLRQEDFGADTLSTHISEALLTSMEALRDPIPALAQFDLHFAKFKQTSAQMIALENLMQLLWQSDSKQYLEPYLAKFSELMECTDSQSSPLAQQYLKDFHHETTNAKLTRPISLKSQVPTR